MRMNRHMIALNLTIREAIGIAAAPGCSHELYDRIVAAIEKQCGDGSWQVTIKTVSVNDRLNAIKAIRFYTGWGLKEAKDMVDDVMAWNRQPGTGIPRSIIIRSGDTAHSLMSELEDLGVIAELSQI